MRRLIIVTLALALALVVAAPAMAAPGGGHEMAGDHHEDPANGPNNDVGSRAASRSFAPLGARLAVSAIISGHVYDSYGAAAAGWYVEADSSSTEWASTQTDASGYYQMTNVAPTGSGNLYAYPDSGTTFARLHDPWSSGGSYGRDFLPGRVQVTANRGGPWQDFDWVTLRLWGDDRYSRGYYNTPDTTSSPVNGLIDTLAGSYNIGGSIKFFYNEGLEVGPMGVTEYFDSGSYNVDEASAQRVSFSSPRWYSCKPGAKVKVVQNNFPAGWINEVSGYTDNSPTYSGSGVFGNVTSSGPANQSYSVKIPTSAKPGYSYWIGLQHADGAGGYYPLYLEECVQLCTLKASKTSIRKGTRIRFSGVVPVQGHTTTAAGTPTVVTFYVHKGTAPVPKKWNPKSLGWWKLGSVKTNGLGAFKSPYTRPTYSATIVYRYPGDNWYWGAYSSPLKIRVRR